MAISRPSHARTPAAPPPAAVDTNSSQHLQLIFPPRDRWGDLQTNEMDRGGGSNILPYSRPPRVVM